MIISLVIPVGDVKMENVAVPKSRRKVGENFEDLLLRYMNDLKPVLLYHNLPVWLDTLDAFTWYRNPAKLMSTSKHNLTLPDSLNVSNEI